MNLMLCMAVNIAFTSPLIVFKVGWGGMIYSTYCCHYATCYDLIEFEGNQYCKIYSIVIRANTSFNNFIMFCLVIFQFSLSDVRHSWRQRNHCEFSDHLVS